MYFDRLIAVHTHTHAHKHTLHTDACLRTAVGSPDCHLPVPSYEQSKCVAPVHAHICMPWKAHCCVCMPWKAHGCVQSVLLPRASPTGRGGVPADNMHQAHCGHPQSTSLWSVRSIN